MAHILRDERCATMNFQRCRSSLAVAFAVLAFGGCSGSAGAPVAPIVTGPQPVTTPSPTPAPSSTPVPAGVALNPSNLSLLGVGASFAQNVVVSQMGFGGTFVFTTAAAGSADSCSSIATAAETATAGTFAITPLANGHCTFTVTGGSGDTNTLTIDVTSSTVGGQ